MRSKTSQLWVFAVMVCSRMAVSDPNSHCAEPQLSLHTDFAGGSAQVLELDQEARRIKILPTPHPGLGWECWWYFRVQGIKPGELLQIEVGDAPWATPQRAAFSLDNKHWLQTDSGVREGKIIRYEQRIDGDQAWFAWGPPFTSEHAQRLAASAAKHVEGIRVFELCRSRAGRPVTALQVQATPDAERFHVWVQARQHAWEAGSSWVCRGLVEWLSSPDERALQLRQRANFYIVPIMDVDNVELGAGGKNQTPHDHNRDWSDEPHWPAVAAAQQRIKALDQDGQFDLFIDLHNPDAGSQRPFFFITPRKLLTERGARNLDRFLATTRHEMTGPLAFTGDVKESGANYDHRWQFISKNWVSMNTQDHVVALTLETAWNTPHSTTDGYRAVGRQLGLAIERYLRTNPREP